MLKWIAITPTLSANRKEDFAYKSEIRHIHQNYQVKKITDKHKCNKTFASERKKDEHKCNKYKTFKNKYAFMWTLFCI